MEYHVLKCDLPFYSSLESGEKNFEYRFNDRDYRIGDILELYAYDREKGSFTGAFVQRRVTYILDHEHAPLTPGWCIMALEEMPVLTDDELVRATARFNAAKEAKS